MLLAHMEDGEKPPKIKPHCTTTLDVHRLTTLLTRKRNTTGLNPERQRKQFRVTKPDFDERARGCGAAKGL